MFYTYLLTAEYFPVGISLKITNTDIIAHSLHLWCVIQILIKISVKLHKNVSSTLFCVIIFKHSDHLQSVSHKNQLYSVEF